ncbi:MAG: DoxX family protein [Tardiphaga sp.]|nr:DoxX family protein [Tardiphaga sp.]
MTTQSPTLTSISPATMNGVAFMGRICLGAIFLWGGYGKAVAMGATIGYFSKLGLPLPAVAAAIAVVVELLGGMLIVLGLLFRPVAVILGLWCLVTALAAHTDFADRNMLIHFFKNIAMLGGFLQAALLVPGAYSIDALLGRQRPTLTTATPL